MTLVEVVYQHLRVLERHVAARLGYHRHWPWIRVIIRVKTIELHSIWMLYIFTYPGWSQPVYIHIHHLRLVLSSCFPRQVAEIVGLHLWIYIKYRFTFLVEFKLIVADLVDHSRRFLLLLCLLDIVSFFLIEVNHLSGFGIRSFEGKRLVLEQRTIGDWN